MIAPPPTPRSSRIIIVEDDQRLARAIERHLTRAGHEVAIAATGEDLRRHYRREGADLVLLDLNLGSEDGMDLARELVGSTPVGVIIVTGRDELQDRIDGLNAGADDYITKPFAIDELLARVRAVLRRRALETSAAQTQRLGRILFDPTAMTLQHDECDASVRLTETETRILARLIQQEGRAVGRAALLGRDLLAPDDRTVDVHVGNIRRKLREAGLDELVIWPVRGFGYRLRVESG